jgi:hypothetical protein
VRLGRVGRAAGTAWWPHPHPCRDARHDHARPERCRDVPGSARALRRTARRAQTMVSCFLLRTDVTRTLGLGAAMPHLLGAALCVHKAAGSSANAAHAPEPRRRRCAIGPMTSTPGLRSATNRERRRRVAADATARRTGRDRELPVCAARLKASLST